MSSTKSRAASLRSPGACAAWMILNSSRIFLRFLLMPGVFSMILGRDRCACVTSDRSLYDTRSRR